MIDFDRVKGSIDLREVVLRYTTLNKRGQGPCPFCGGKDRFYLFKGHWKCNQCHEGGDVIELVHKVEGVTRAEAAKSLGGNQLPGGNHQRGRSRVFPVYKKEPETPPAWLDPAWQKRALEIVERAEAQLIDSPGFAYFEGRGITEVELLKSQRIGYVPDKFGRPAVVLPWCSGDSITAIKYRFIDQGKQRFAQEKGSEPILYGPIKVTGSDSSTLVVVEGEINALVLAQATAPKRYDVLSVGSEGNTKGLDALTKLVKAEGYSRLLFWFDKPERAAAAAKRFPGSAAMQSPGGKDAADLLKEFAGSDLLKEFAGSALLELVDAMLSSRYKDAGVSNDLPGAQTPSVAILEARIRGSAPIVPDRDVLSYLYDALGDRLRSCPVRQLYLDVDMKLIEGKSLEPIHERMIELMAVDQQNGTRWVLDLVEYLFPDSRKAP